MRRDTQDPPTDRRVGGAIAHQGLTTTYIHLVNTWAYTMLDIRWENTKGRTEEMPSEAVDRRFSTRADALFL